MPWNQHADWSGSNFFIEGTTSNRDIVVCDGDNITMPPIMGRANFDIVAAGSIGVCGGITNPTTTTLWIEKVTLYVATPSSGASALSLGVAAAAATAASSASNIADATLATDTGGYITLDSSLLLPEVWSTGTFVTAYQPTASTTLVGSFSIFYVSAVTT